MSARPDVSVVMGVYNGAASLRRTLSSVLDQEGCDFEFIVIDDGSNDGTAAILDEYAAREARLRVVHQRNAGLTASLIRGCALAAGEFIARQDAGDVSLPGRLAAQAAFLREHPQVVMTSCAARFVGPMGEALYEVRKPLLDLDAGLRASTKATLSGPPHHGATMFRRAAYNRVGGYRAPFVVAQDLDLWLRLVELGQCLGTGQVHYQARLEAGSISSRRRGEQLRMANLALVCKFARSDVGSDELILARTAAPPVRKGALSRTERARFHYFVASCLRQQDPVAARPYFGAALRQNPFHVKALIRWAMG